MTNLDIPCTKYCNRKEHGDFIISALTKRAVTDIDLSAFINYTCILCGSSKDSYGRTGLHMAASCGRTDVCKWLVCQKQAKIDEKDTESGYTSLHRSIFCGKLDTAIALIQLGANLKLLDANDLTPLDHAMLDNLSPIGDQYSLFIYVWGSNTNYTLGPNQVRNHPEALESFHKAYPQVEPKEIWLEKFHTLILSKTGAVYSFGHGQGGRLGIGTEKTVLEPTEIKFISNNSALVGINACAIARDHCLFLSNTNEVWSCGLNAHHVLGIYPPPAQLLTPRHVSKLKATIEGIACGRYHSVAWNSAAVYTWGFHGGQLGHDKSKETTISQPKVVKCLSLEHRKVISVAASLGATAIATDKGDVYILHEYQCRAIASKMLGIVSVNIYGGKVAIMEEKREDLRVVALTRCGNIHVWQETDPQLCRCTFSLNRLLIVKQVCLNAYGLVFITEDREVFHGKFKARKKKTQQSNKKHFNHFLERNSCVQVQVEKVSRLYGANSVVCDLEGLNFASLHLNTSSMITLIPEISQSAIAEDFAQMMRAGEVEADVTFKVGSRMFPVHQYIVRANSEILDKMSEIDGIVPIKNVEPEIFQEIVEYLYTGTCKMLIEGPIPQELAKFNRKKKTRKENNMVIAKNVQNKSAAAVHSQRINENRSEKVENEISDPLRLLQQAAKKLGINSLHKELNLFEICSGNIRMKHDKVYRKRFLKYKRGSYPELFDVRIKANCGSCVDAHKCILAARSEFFANMFSMRWLQSSTSSRKTEIELPSTLECISHLLDYLYTDQVDLENEDVNQILALLILADHILLDRLVEVCEFALSKLITIKNVLRMLIIADMYNSTQLKTTCMEYTCLNLALMLETRHLEQLDNELLTELTHFYAVWNKKMQQRVITPFSDATSDETITAVSAKYPVKMDFNEIITVQKQKAHRRRNRTHCTSMSVSMSDNKDCALETSVGVNIPLETLGYSATGDEWTKVDGQLSKSIQERLTISETTPIRIHAVCKGHEQIASVTDKDDFVNLSRLSERDFPDLSSSIGSPPVEGFIQHRTTPKQKGKMPKLSQKERKRLSSETSIMKEIEPESLKNPWNMSFETSSPVSSTFGNILSEEKKQRENLSRIRSKLLIYTQMEDKALDDLRKFYNVDNIFDEVIEISRVDCGQIAAPLWIQK